ncbi:amidase family protein [Streptomyces sp. NBC_00988]|nr:amidase family protein [Streptomyces sp. NBC_00988]
MLSLDERHRGTAHGPVANALRPKKISDGSSSGSAAAVTLGDMPLGTDTEGSGIDDRSGGRRGLGEARQGGGADRKEGDDAHLDVFDSGEGVGDVVRRQGQVESAEGGHAESQSALLQGDQNAAADAGQVCGDGGEDAAE